MSSGDKQPNTERIASQNDLGWEHTFGDLYINCAVVVCYVCHTPLLLVPHQGIVTRSNAVYQAERRGWALEPSDLWACPNCKDVPQAEHEGHRHTYDPVETESVRNGTWGYCKTCGAPMWQEQGHEPVEDWDFPMRGK